jgi:hypothetical protein
LVSHKTISGNSRATYFRDDAPGGTRHQLIFKTADEAVKDKAKSQRRGRDNPAIRHAYGFEQYRRGEEQLIALRPQRNDWR